MLATAGLAWPEQWLRMVNERQPGHKKQQPKEGAQNNLITQDPCHSHCGKRAGSKLLFDLKVCNGKSDQQSQVKPGRLSQEDSEKDKWVTALQTGGSLGGGALVTPEHPERVADILKPPSEGRRMGQESPGQIGDTLGVS